MKNTSAKPLSTNGHGKSKKVANGILQPDTNPSVESNHSKELLRVLTEVKNGNLMIRMPIDEVGLAGKVSDAINQIIEVNRKLMFEIQERNASDEKVQHMNRTLIENLGQLEKTNHDLDRFVAMASHDLQEPLRKIRVFSGILNEKYKDILQDDTQIVSRIDNAAERMQALVSSILALSKASSEKIVLEKCDLHMMLEEMRDNMQEETKENKVSIFIGPIPLLFASPGLMRQLFQNLIGNAIKYRRKDINTVIKISSEISLPTRNKDNEMLAQEDCIISVQDNGIGFDQKHSEEIFGMLKKLNDNTEYEGTGIGLTLCRKIAELHHGFITARSIVNEGSIFAVSLPLFHEELVEN